MRRVDLCLFVCCVIIMLIYCVVFQISVNYYICLHIMHACMHAGTPADVES
eukprot:SAG11_NODE_24314_length_375_cov_0.731884_1_plen_50_part_01